MLINLIVNRFSKTQQI